MPGRTVNVAAVNVAVSTGGGAESSDDLGCDCADDNDGSDGPEGAGFGDVCGLLEQAATMSHEAAPNARRERFERIVAVSRIQVRVAGSSRSGTMTLCLLDCRPNCR